MKDEEEEMRIKLAQNALGAVHKALVDDMHSSSENRWTDEDLEAAYIEGAEDATEFGDQFDHQMLWPVTRIKEKIDAANEQKK